MEALCLRTVPLQMQYFRPLLTFQIYCGIQRLISRGSTTSRASCSFLKTATIPQPRWTYNGIETKQVWTWLVSFHKLHLVALLTSLIPISLRTDARYIYPKSSFKPEKWPLFWFQNWQKPKIAKLSIPNCQFYTPWYHWKILSVVQCISTFVMLLRLCFRFALFWIFLNFPSKFLKIDLISVSAVQYSIQLTE